MKDILIIAHFTQIPGEKGNNRFDYITKKINKEMANVEVVTSSFSHRSKQQRKKTNSQLNNIDYKVTMLYEPGYKKNVSISRFYSHYILGHGLKKYLNNRKKPDVIYCAVPSLDVANVAARYAKKNNIRFIIDIQDLWPEAFKLIIHMPIISDLLFYPMKKKADFIYSSADEIVAVSKTYAERALKVNDKCKKAYDIFLGTDLVCFDKLSIENKVTNKPSNEIWLAYIGTLGHSYDLTCVIDALEILINKGEKNIKFIVMGDGPLKDKFEEYARNKEIYVEFTGRLDYGQMVGILTSCDMAANPISHGAAQSIINKHGDYAAAGLPVLNTQECLEYRNLVDKYQMGLNCMNSNAKDFADKLLLLCENPELRKDMGRNSRKLAEEKFNRAITYSKIIDLIEMKQ